MKLVKTVIGSTVVLFCLTLEVVFEEIRQKLDGISAESVPASELFISKVVKRHFLLPELLFSPVRND